MLGLVYFVLVPRVYDARTSLRVLMWMDPSFTFEDDHHLTVMDPFCKLFSSEVVLRDAIRRLKREHREDFEDATREQWTILQKNVRAQNVRGTNTLNVAYRSRNPRLAMSILDAIVSAFLAFTEEHPPKTRTALLHDIVEFKWKIEEQLRAKQAELLAAWPRGETVRDEDREINMLVARAMSLNEAAITALEKRIKTRSQLDAIPTAMDDKEALRQSALAVLGPVGYAAVRYKRLGSRETSDNELASTLLAAARKNLRRATAHEKAILADYDEVKQELIQLDRPTTRLSTSLQEVERLRGRYGSALESIRQAVSGPTRAFTITKPRDPEVVLVSPRADLVALYTAALGLFGGLVMVSVVNLLGGKRNASSGRYERVR